MLTTGDLSQLKKVIKGELSGFATKDDLKDFATKDDLKSFANRDDLKGFATKDDLKGFATKDDLKGLATKADQVNFVTKDDLSSQFKPIRIDIKALKSDVTHIRKDVKTMISFFDREYLKLRERVERIEEHLHLPLVS